jgi:hypothetical protein
MPTIADQPITRGEIRMHEQGDWFADIATNSGERIADGTRVEVVAGNRVFSGAIVRGGITDEVGRYQVAGRPEWDQPLPARATAAYRSANAVLRQTVLVDLARDVLGSGWAALVVMPPAASLGQHYERPGTSGGVIVRGADALNLLGLPWYVREDGLTVFGVRPSGVVTTEERVLVEYRNDAIGYRVVNCEDVAAFAPGLTFEGETIGEVVYSLSADDIKMHVWTRAASSVFSDAVRAVWRRLFPRQELQGVFSYVTVGPSQAGKHELRSTKSRHLPDVKLADMWSAAGFAAELAAGTRVLVSFADGDPSSPVLVAVEPGIAPASSTLDAVSSVGIDAVAVNLGTAEAPVIRNGDAVTIATLPGPTPIAAGYIFLGPPFFDPTPTLLGTKVKA